MGQGRLVEARPAEEPEDPDESMASILRKRVRRMLHELDRELDDVEAKVKTTLKLMDKDDDGVVSREEVKGALGFLNASMEESELHAFLEQLPDQLPLENLLEKIKEQNDEVEWVPPLCARIEYRGRRGRGHTHTHAHTHREGERRRGEKEREKEREKEVWVVLP